MLQIDFGCPRSSRTHEPSGAADQVRSFEVDVLLMLFLFEAFRR